MENQKYMTENPEWVSFSPEWTWGIEVNQAGYFDERPYVKISITQLLAFALIPALLWASPWGLFSFLLLLGGWGRLYINLPIKTGIQDCESAGWGFNFHNDSFWVYVGGGANYEGGRKAICFRLPWSLKWVRTSIKMRGGEWFHETEKNRIDWTGEESQVGSHKWVKANKWQETHPFTDKYDGTVVNATISVEEREWRPKGALWAWFWAKKRLSINVEFDKEVGRKKGSWKGGTIGCGYDLRPNESPLDALQRMEKEKEF